MASPRILNRASFSKPSSSSRSHRNYGDKRRGKETGMQRKRERTWSLERRRGGIREGSSAVKAIRFVQPPFRPTLSLPSRSLTLSPLCSRNFLSSPRLSILPPPTPSPFDPHFRRKDEHGKRMDGKRKVKYRKGERERERGETRINTKRCNDARRWKIDTDIVKRVLNLASCN